jgi:hypothetical protein
LTSLLGDAVNTRRRAAGQAVLKQPHTDADDNDVRASVRGRSILTAVAAQTDSDQDSDEENRTDKN